MRCATLRRTSDGLRRLEFRSCRFAMIVLRVGVAHALCRLGVDRGLEFTLEITHALLEFDQASAHRTCDGRQAIPKQEDRDNTEHQPMNRATKSHFNSSPVDRDSRPLL